MIDDFESPLDEDDEEFSRDLEDLELDYDD